MHLLLFAVSLALLSGCSMMQPVKPVEVKTIAERPPMYHPPLPMEMQLTDINPGYNARVFIVRRRRKRPGKALLCFDNKTVRKLSYEHG